MTNLDQPILRIGDKCIFTEDDWATAHSGTIKDVSIYSYFVDSLKYGSMWIPKNNVMKVQN